MSEKMILFKNRNTGKIEKELVYHGKVLHFLYKQNFLSRFFRALLSKLSVFSIFYGFTQRLKITKKKIKPFIEKYNVDQSEFVKPVDAFTSFNDFFTRELKKETRPIVQGENIAIIPADGRFLFYDNIAHAEGFLVKGKKFTLEKLLNSSRLAKEYANGSLVLGRLCPIDYHRFHFPCGGVPGYPRLINGPLYSVNPVALKNNIHIFTENKRMITEIATEKFGKVLYIEVGATMVGAIHETFTPQKYAHKGDEKGFFSFGGSSIILIFEENTIRFDQDLLETSKDLMETRCLLGQSMGQSMCQASQ